MWRAETSVSGDQWTAELWIPFSQLRFNPRTDQTWGLNLYRFRPTLDEADYWILIPRTVRAWASRFGEVSGINGVVPPRRIEALPYMAGGSTLNGDRDRGNPFDDGRNLQGRVGADIKMGLGPNLTLETAINPDFGQVEADPAEVNLTAFETRFPEKRPFFLEGAQLFNIGHPNFYYSRRIGARPIGPATGDYVDYPDVQHDPRRRQADRPAAVEDVDRVPRRGHRRRGRARGDVECGGCSASNMRTSRSRRTRTTWSAACCRSSGRRPRRPASCSTTCIAISRRAARWRISTRAMRLAWPATRCCASRAASTSSAPRAAARSWTAAEKAVERVQRSSAHYAQRPDRDYSPLDPTLTSLAGWSVQVNFDKTGGRHWLWGANTKIDSENFETNDIAQLNGADGWLSNANIRYRETQPGKVFRSYYVQLDTQTDTTLRRLMQTGHLRGTVNVTWANFWTSQVQFSRDLATTSVSLTRGGPLMARGPGWTHQRQRRQPRQSRTRVTANAFNRPTTTARRISGITGMFSMRPGPRWQFSVSPYYDRVTEPQQYISTLTGGRPVTYNNRYVFAFIDRSTMSMEYRLGLTLKPDVNLDIYAEPFAASGRYYDYGELLEPASRERLTYGTDGTILAVDPDGSQVVNAAARPSSCATATSTRCRSGATWCCAGSGEPASTLYVVWQQDRAGTEMLRRASALTMRSAR